MSYNSEQVVLVVMWLVRAVITVYGWYVVGTWLVKVVGMWLLKVVGNLGSRYVIRKESDVACTCKWLV